MCKVSVIVPNYNHARYLPRRIESILRQSFQDFELILLDDCSTDESRSVLSRYADDPRVRLGFNDANSGSTFKQWNKGVRMAKGEYVWIAESDDYADEKLLGTLVRALDRDEHIVFAYCRSWHVDADGVVSGSGDRHLDVLDAQLWAADFVMDGREHCRKYSLRSPVIGNASGAVFRKSAYENVGGADESLRLCGDWKLWAAMALTGPVAYANARLNYFRYHSPTVRSATAFDGRDVIEKLLVLRWILDQVGADDVDVQHACEEAANHWVPAVMSLKMSVGAKRAIWRLVKAFDRHPMMRLGRPGTSAVRRKLAKQWRALRLALRLLDARRRVAS
ncbi:MAG: glycosyltransferase [Candidatus Acidiferrales bacterium]